MHRSVTYVEDLVGVIGLNVDAAAEAQEPDEHKHGGDEEDQVREHGHARGYDGVVVVPDDRHGGYLLAADGNQSTGFNLILHGRAGLAGF